MNDEQPRDDHGRWTSGSGLALWAKHRHHESAAHLIARATAGRHWTDRLPKGMRAETWMGNFDKNPAEGGKPTAERERKVHAPIIEAAFRGVHKPDADEQKVAIFTMGPPASGKSSMLRAIDHSRFVTVDPDAIKEQLPEYKKAIDPGRTYRGAAKMAHEESSYIAKQVLKRAVDEGHHVVVDGTGANADSIVRKMQQLKAAGYHVHLAYAHLGDVQEGLRRVNARALATGRYVPEDFARSAYASIPRNFERIAREADSFAVHDSARKDNPVVWEKKPGGEEVFHDEPFVTTFRTRYGKSP